MIFLLIAATASYDYPRIPCTGRVGKIGKIGYYRQDNDKSGNVYQRDLDQYYYEGNTYDYNWLAGSFCPKQTGETEVLLRAYPTVYWMFDYDFPTDIKYHAWCTGWESHTYKKVLYKNRCYPLAVAYWTQCAGSEGYAAFNGTRITSSTATIMDCYTQDCLPGYYGDICDKEVDADCNGNGTPKDGRTSDGIGCNCNSYGNNLFCEDASKNRFSKPGVTFKSYYDAAKPDVTYTQSDFSFHEFGESYSTVELNANLYVPQNTDLEFEFKAVPNAQLFINGQLVAGGLESNIFECSEKTIKTYTTPRKRYAKGTYSIRVVMRTGCAMYQQGIGLRWKFYRWYSNNPPGFENIPVRYLGAV